MCLKIVMRELEPIWLQQGKYHAHFQDEEFTIDSLIPLRIYDVDRKGQVQSKR